MTATFKLDDDGYLDFSGGTLHVLTGSAAIVQGVTSRLRFFRGEFFADLERGFPYRQKVFVKNPNLGDIAEEARTIILGSPGITAVEFVEVTLNTTTRVATIEWRATTIDGDSVDEITEL